MQLQELFSQQIVFFINYKLAIQPRTFIIGKLYLKSVLEHFSLFISLEDNEV